MRKFINVNELKLQRSEMKAIKGGADTPIVLRYAVYPLYGIKPQPLYGIVPQPMYGIVPQPLYGIKPTA